jgi:LmbE family N-acetylglucosaminyl deacetylase
MIRFGLNPERGQGLTILCLGAHADDIEIGCGGTLLRLLSEHPDSVVHWAVFSATGERHTEAERAAHAFAGAHLGQSVIYDFRDGFLPYSGTEVKAVFEADLKNTSPDLIFTHNGNDAHQDHRLISELTRNTFRNHLILEYEVPKYDGDLGQPAFFVPLEPAAYQTKVELIVGTFASQRHREWFRPETFLALLRLRGMECRAPSGYAEAFYCRKAVL